MEKKLDFIERVVAFLNGDDEEVVAANIKRKALSYLKAATGNYDVMLIKADEKIESAQEKLEKALMNNGSTEFTENYISNLVNANNALIEAQEKKVSIEEIKKFLEEQMNNINN